MCSSIVLKGNKTPHLSLQGTVRNTHFSVSWVLRSLLSTSPQVSLLGQLTKWYSHFFRCFNKSPFLITFVHFWFMHLMLSSFTSLRMGMLGIMSLFIVAFIAQGAVNSMRGYTWGYLLVLDFICNAGHQNAFFTEQVVTTGRLNCIVENVKADWTNPPVVT